jgi:hypothetical protein
MGDLAANPQQTRLPAGATRGPISGVTWRSVGIATILAPPVCYWEVMMGEVRYSGHPTTVSLFFDVIFCVLVIRLANELLRWKLPRFALSQAELLVIYTCLSISVALAGHDGIQMLAPIISAPYWYATPENKWEQSFFAYLPRPWIVSDHRSLEALFEGGTTLYSPAHFGPWIVPVLVWTAFMAVLLFVMLCLNALIRQQWTEHEKLSYPLTAVPLQITEPKGTLFRNGLMWVGFLVAAGIDAMNGLHLHYPVVPYLQVRVLDISPYVTTKPWKAIGWTPISFYPFAIGLGYLLPQDQLFSCWFFFFYWKAMRVASSVLGYEPQSWTASAPPYLNEQAFGGYVGLFAFSLWAMRGMLPTLWRQVTGRAPARDAEEPQPRTAARGGAEDRRRPGHRPVQAETRWACLDTPQPQPSAARRPASAGRRGRSAQRRCAS